MFIVRRYRPAYFTGFDEPADVVLVEKILDAPWLEKFKHSDFKEFRIEDYHNGEQIVSAMYEKERWVAAFAIPEDSPLKTDWRYKNPQRIKS